MTLKIEEMRPLDGLTTLGLRARARYYAEAHSTDDIRELTAKAAELGVPVRLLGAGANTVAMPEVDALVIRVMIGGIEFTTASDGDTLVTCGAGETFDDVITESLAHGAGGLENLSAIPGTVGGAVVQNIGAYGVELAERVVSVRVWDPRISTERVLSVEECDFSYRHSFLKTPAGEGCVVLSAVLRLPAAWTPVTGYRDLDAEIAARSLTPDALTPAVMADCVRTVRARKLPDPAVLGNAGSFFTNPIVNKVHWRELLEKHPSMVYYKLGGGRMKLAAAWLIEAAGLRGMTDGPAGVYDRHALILVNHGGATGEDILRVAQKVIARVQQEFGVTLEMEPVVMK